MGFMDKFKEKASNAANSAKNAASSAKAKYEEKKETMAAEKAERERVRAEKQAEADSATQEMLGKMQEVNGALFEIDSKQLLDFTADFYDKLYLPAHSVSNSKLVFHPLDKKIDKTAQKEFSEYNPSNESPVLMILGKHHQCVLLTTKALYFKKAYDEEHQFFCIGSIPIENIATLTYTRNDESYVVTCNGVELFNNAYGFELDTDSFSEYISRIERRDFTITNEQIDALIQKKIGDKVLKIVREYVYEDELILYFAWGCDSITAKDFVVCTDKQMVVLDREAFGLTKNVKQFYYEDVTSNGIEIVDWYCDEAKSGKTADRPEFQRMIAKVKDNPDFDMIIVHKLDRLSRNIEDSIKYKRLIEDCGLEVFSLNEGFGNSPNGNFMYNMMSVMNQYYIDNLATEVMKGLRENAYQCKWTGGIPPLGYDVNEEKKLVINEKEAEAVRLIFEMTADGEGYGAIINKLNILGYKTKKGRTFGKNSLYDLLRNERYKGTYIFNKRSKANYQNKRNNHRFKNDDEIIRIENGCPAIVSESLWNRANAVKKATRCSYTNAKHPYLLTGLLYCAECGAKMHGNCRQDRYGIRSTGYRCSSRTNKHACNCKEIRCSKLDNFVIDKFKQYFFNDENIKVITEKVNQKLNDNSILANECKEVKNNLRTLKVQRNNLVDAIAQTGINQTLKDKLNECEDNIAKAEAFIQHCESQKIDCTVTEEDIRKLIDELKEYMSNPTSLVTTKFILSQYIERVDVSNETILVTLKVTLPPTAGGNSFCPIILHTESIRRKKVINSSALDNIFLL